MANDSILLRQTLFNAKPLEIGTYNTQPIVIGDLQLVGNITLQIEVTGDGVLTTNYLVSNSYDKKTKIGDFVLAVSGSNIAALSTFEDTSGNAANPGKDHADIPMNNAEAFKLQFVVATDSIVLSAWLSMQ